MTDTSPGRGMLAVQTAPGVLVRSTLKTLGAVFAAALVVFTSAGTHSGFGAETAIAAAAALLVIFALVLAGLRHHPHRRFGYANLVTAVRASMICLIGATVFLADGFGSSNGILWSLILLTSLALLLDGADGYLARRTREASELGARFDMEMDALLILILSAGVFHLGKAGAWVLLIGLMRYAFVLAQLLLPRLRGSLAPSFRRQLICVIQVGVLCSLLLPFVVPPLSAFAASAALALLVYSFALDIRALWTAQARPA